MARLLLEIFSWITTAGFVVFFVLYLVLAAPWKDKMGRGILVFMGSMSLAFIYALTGRLMTETMRISLWLIIMPILSISIWSAVITLIIYQVKARKQTEVPEEGP